MMDTTTSDFTKTFGFFKKLAKRVAPPPPHTISSWADAYRKLSAEASSEPGQWRTDRTPYMRAIMDAFIDPNLEQVVVMSSAQVGKTELLLNIVGYYVDYDPAPMMLIQPTEGLAEAFSKDRLAPMIRDTETLAAKISDVKSRDGENTILHKKYPGGQITLGGANAPASLASRPIRIVLCDEVDRYPASAGTEGDPVSLAVKRTTTFWNRKIALVSTPTIKGVSRIEAAYMASTMEQWCLPCPSCGEHQPLSWEQVRFDDASLVCKYCGAIHGEFNWKEGTGKWIARKPESKSRGFHLNELASPWKRWSTIIEEFKEAKKDTETLKVWINTSLGETWEEKGEQLEEDDLLNRREAYDAPVPAHVKLLTAGVDVQNDRLEIEVVGWGKGKESWGIEYRILYGDPTKSDVWKDLDDYVSRAFHKSDGSGLMVACTCIDSGNGNHSTEIYRYCVKREHRRIFAIKGQGGLGISFVGRMSRTPREKCALFIIGVDAGKENIMTRLKNKFEGTDGYCHFPTDATRGYGEEYFHGLTSEKKVIRFHKGRPRIEWIKKGGARNEPLDVRNYATAALEILNPNLDKEIPVATASSKPNAQAAAPRKRGTISKGIGG
ncbi:phage terminase large subunit family protein [Paenibacillus anseongense]|uniref:phage terminase large subunit family protein n=1 Tax=Paenibacillus anseongense TaxID=2682845 RepID=UPI002DB83FBA|nr:phage terminase large subunit family protein [Paenibacillus anseongense]MEC0269070.1 phage terminase large subunit family protein [Paenibacillus anseongense]